MELAVTTYLVYVLTSVALTIWVARTLFKNGRAFLVDVFHENETLADSVNHLLVVGFYLINLGYISLTLKLRGTIPGTREAIEALSGKIGMVLVALGIMHFANLYVFSQLRRRSVSRPPVGAASAQRPTCAPQGQ
jgi:uncharacterized BrkB/YihY/UPF0761 family membrane protein